MTNKISRPGSRMPIRISIISVALVAGLAVGLLGGASSSAQVSPRVVAPKYKATKSLTYWKKGKPRVAATVSAKVTGGRQITRVVIKLPSGFSWRTKHLGGRVTVKGRRFAHSVRGKSLFVVPNTPNKDMIIHVKSGAISVSKKARKDKHPTVTLKITEKVPGTGTKTITGPGGTTTVTTSTTSTITTTITDTTTQLDTTLTTLIDELEGLPTNTDPLAALATDLGMTVDGLGTSLTDLVGGLDDIGTGQGGTAAQGDLTTAATDLQTAFTDLENSDTAGAEAAFEAAATALENAGTAAGSSLGGDDAAQLAAALDGIAAELGSIGGVGTGGNAGTELQGTLTALLTALPTDLSASNPLAALIGSLGTIVTDLGTTVSNLGTTLTSLDTGSSATDVSAALTHLQSALTYLGSGDTTDAQMQLNDAASALQSALTAAGGNSFSGASNINALIGYLNSLSSDLPGSGSGLGSILSLL